MKIFIDTSIFFNLVEGNKREQEKIRTLLKHAKHAGYTLTTSITVYGEIVQVCFRDKRKELYAIFNFVKDLDITCWLPNKQLRICCSCLDKIDPEDRVGLSDKTHLAYSMSYDDDYFLTSDSDLMHFPLNKCHCKTKCELNRKTEGKIISLSQLKEILQKK